MKIKKEISRRDCRLCDGTGQAWPTYITDRKIHCYECSGTGEFVKYKSLTDQQIKTRNLNKQLLNQSRKRK